MLGSRDPPPKNNEESTDGISRIFDGLDHTILLVDSPRRRQLFSAFEEFIQMDWQRNRFKSSSHPLIARIASTIFQIDHKIHFSNDKIWFGGVSSTRTFSLSSNSTGQSSSNMLTGQQDQQSQFCLNSIAYFSLGIILLGLLEETTLEETISAENVELFMARLDSTFSSSPDYFIDALLENDERCLRTMPSLLRLNTLRKNFPPPPSMLNPDVLFLSLLHKIHFDPLVVIDWIGSEPELSYVFLKEFSHHLSHYSAEQFGHIFESFCDLPKEAEVKWDVVRADSAHSSTKYDDADFHFSIEELHGEQRVFKRIRIPTANNNFICKRRPGGEEEFSSQNDAHHLLSTKLASFCADLGAKLKKLAASLRFPAKTICQNLSAIESTLSPQ